MPLTLDALAVLDAIDCRGSFVRAAEEPGRADVWTGVLDAA
ncbi:MAG: hypothetical protein ACK4SR_03025 [Thiobacillus sp.]